MRKLNVNIHVRRASQRREEINTQCFVDLLLATVHVGLTFYFQRPL